MDNKRIVGTVMLDFTAAFDIIDHALLIAKLKCYGFADTALSWVESYLSGKECFSMEAYHSAMMSSGECLKEAVWVLFYFLSIPMTCPMFWN